MKSRMKTRRRRSAERATRMTSHLAKICQNGRHWEFVWLLCLGGSWWLLGCFSYVYGLPPPVRGVYCEFLLFLQSVESRWRSLHYTDFMVKYMSDYVGANPKYLRLFIYYALETFKYIQIRSVPTSQNQVSCDICRGFARPLRWMNPFWNF